MRVPPSESSNTPPREPFPVPASPATAGLPTAPVTHSTDAATCDYCGSTDLHWVKCKLICGNCRQINKSCADL